MRTLLFYLFITVGITSCSLKDCPPDIEIARFELLDESHSFFLYKGNENLIFVDQDGQEHTLTVTFFDEYDSRIVKDVLCSETFVGGQEEYYATTTKRITLKDTLNGGYIDVTLSTSMSNRDDLDSTIVYDNIHMDCGTEKFSTISSTIITGFHQDLMNDRDPNEYLNVALYIGDTTINNTTYKDVYRGTDFRGKIYYNKQNGILSIYSSQNDFLELK